MYYPKNKIKTGLYTNGEEYIYADDRTSYTGFYYSLYNGTFFEGKSPTTGNKELIYAPSAQTSIQQDTPNTISQVATFFTPQSSLDYSSGNTSIIVLTNQVRQLPTSFFPKPSSYDYSIGQFVRYFCKKTNENIFLEINQNDYANLYNNNDNYVYSLYIPFKTYWLISGDYNKVIQTNYKLVHSVEKDLQVNGFSKFIEKTGGYNKFYF